MWDKRCRYSPDHQGGHYFTLSEHFAIHESVSHKADEYVRGDVHTNTVDIAIGQRPEVHSA
jgi:hypothetical protein